jgi:uncharacterized membrane protein YhaH (DUF805 family)
MLNIVNQKTGWIEVICGSMFSGKTEELIRRIRRAEYAKQKVQFLSQLLIIVMMLITLFLIHKCKQRPFR